MQCKETILKNASKCKKTNETEFVSKLQSVKITRGCNPRELQAFL